MHGLAGGMSAHLEPCGDDHIDAGVCRLDRLPRGSNLVLMDQAGVLDPRNVAAREPCGRGHHAQPVSQCAVRVPGLKHGADVDVGERKHLSAAIDPDRDIDRKRPVGQRGAFLDVLAEGACAGGKILGHPGH